MRFETGEEREKVTAWAKTQTILMVIYCQDIITELTALLDKQKKRTGKSLSKH